MAEIILLTEALIDIENAAEWYAQKQAGLGIEYKEAVFTAIDKLQSDVIKHKAVYRGLNKVIVKRFPYLVYFKAAPGNKQITVYAVLHMKQSKSVLNKRK